jgi:hypothetical protein
LKAKYEPIGAYLLARPVILARGHGGRELQQHKPLLGHLVRPRLQTRTRTECPLAHGRMEAAHRRETTAPRSSTYIERHELRRPGVEGQRGLALVDAVAGEHPPLVRAVGRAPVTAVPARRRRGPRVEVVGVARGGDGARGEGGLPGGGERRG